MAMSSGQWQRLRQNDGNVVTMAMSSGQWQRLRQNDDNGNVVFNGNDKTSRRW
jgi:hypothetical protein